MKDFIKAMKLVPYGLNFKKQFIFGICFFLGGVAFLIANSFGHGNSTLGGFYVAFSAMFLVQMVISLTVSDLVQSSPYKKRMQTLYPNLIGVVMCLITYSIFIGILMFQENRGVGISEENIVTIYRVSLMLVVTEFYMAFVYKHFIVSVIFTLISIYALMIISKWTEAFLCETLGKYGFAPAIITGYVILFVGFGLAYLISLGNYKKPLDKLAFGASLKKAGA